MKGQGGTAHQAFDPQVMLENHWLLINYKMMVDNLQSKETASESPQSSSSINSVICDP